MMIGAQRMMSLLASLSTHRSVTSSLDIRQSRTTKEDQGTRNLETTLGKNEVGGSALSHLRPGC
jgi:hypothetical protein